MSDENSKTGEVKPVADQQAAVPAASPEAETLLVFPTEFPVKIMGPHVDGFPEAIVALVQEHAPDFDPQSLETRPSRQGNYLAVTATINATSKAQLDALYQALTDHPMVKVAL